MPRYRLATLAGLLSLTACAPMTAPGHSSAATQLTGIVWKAEDLGGGGIIDRSHVTLALGADDVATGSGGCNPYTARYVLTGDKLKISGIASTEKACAPALMYQEARYIALLAQVAKWWIEPTGALVLTTSNGARFAFSRTNRLAASRPAGRPEPKETLGLGHSISSTNGEIHDAVGRVRQAPLQVEHQGAWLRRHGSSGSSRSRMMPPLSTEHWPRKVDAMERAVFPMPASS